MDIKVITLFDIPFGGPGQTRQLDKTFLTALSIWLVEAINNPNCPQLVFEGTPFIWLEKQPDHKDSYFKVIGLDNGMNMLEARELLDDIDSLAGCELLMEDSYPQWHEHIKAEEPGKAPNYQVAVCQNGLLMYTDYKKVKSLLPIALKLSKDSEYYTFVTGTKESESSPYYKF